MKSELRDVGVAFAVACVLGFPIGYGIGVVLGPIGPIVSAPFGFLLFHVVLAVLRGRR